LSADRASIFITSNDKKNLTLMMAEGAKEITVPVGVGIAGGVAETGKSVNIADCYADSRFDPSFDKKTGYKTNNMLCAAIKVCLSLVGLSFFFWGVCLLVGLFVCLVAGSVVGSERGDSCRVSGCGSVCLDS
jgi:hypothetical protein